MVIVLLAASLSIDSLGIGISYGLRKIKTPVSAKLIISLISVLITCAALFLGNALLQVIPAFLASIFGSSMLLLFGIYVLFSSILKKPESFDEDASKRIDPKEAFFLGIALSIDSFGAGVSSAVGGLNSVAIPFLVGLCQIIFLYSGEFLGRKLIGLNKLSSRFFSIISGLLLITISIIRFFI